MLAFPESAFFNRVIPKVKFYERLPKTSKLRRLFIDQINEVRWRYKIAPSTVNVAPGKNAVELQVFEVRLKSSRFDPDVLRQIDKAISYYILFLLAFEGKYQAWIGYKEFSARKKDECKIGNYYHTDWLTEEELPLKLEGLDVDAVYENFVRQVAGDALRGKNGESLKESVERDERRRMLQKQIAALEAKVRCEKQFNKQVKLNAELRLLKRKHDELL